MSGLSVKHRTWPQSLILSGVVACFVLSGFAALLYQTAWMRQFSLVFGTSELAIAAVLSAYMGGLAFGASLAARYVSRITRPVLYYGLLEAGIALSALSVPLLLQFARFLYVGYFGGQPEPVDASGLGQSFFYLAVAFIVLIVPTAFMGATLPLLTRYVVNSEDQIGTRVGLLYAANTVGAIGGTVVAGFLLLPRLGLNGTVWVGVVVNLLVFVMAALIAKNIGALSAPADTEASNKRDEADPSVVSDSSPRNRYLLILPIMLLSGSISFIYEVLWTRLLGHILGGSIAAFATMLAGFLSGIAIGSAIASRFARTRDQATRHFILAQMGVAVTSIAIYQLLPFAIPESAGLGGNIVFAVLVLMPATIFIGATFPLAVRVLATSRADAAPASARVYSWNTVGAIAGATLAAFYIIPLLKYEGTIKLAVLLNASLGFAVALLATNRGKATIALSAFFILGTLGFYHPKMPEEILRSSPVYPQPGGKIVFYEVGRSATVVVIEENGLLFLRTNGLPEAAANVLGSPPERRSQLYLSILPVLARPQTESMLVVGFGGGVALESVPKSVLTIDVIELEPEVIEANRFYGDRRETNPLDDPRINIVINDARSALSLTDKKYDAIVSQPSHPWTAGASHLYSREFMQLASDHLTDDGVFLQWMNAGFVDEFLLKALAASVLDVFPHARMYQADPGTIFFIGSKQPLDVERQMARTGRPLNDDVLSYLESGFGSPEDMLVALVMDEENLQAFSSGTPYITDNRNYMATVSSGVLDRGSALNAYRFFELVAPYDPLIDPDNWIGTTFPTPVNYSYISMRLDAMGWHSRALGLAERLYEERNIQAVVVNALGLEQQGNLEESQNLLRRALESDPTNQQARWALLRPWFGAIFRGREIPMHIRDEITKIQGSALHVFQALEAMEVGDMATILYLDAELAAVLPTDQWYATSVKLRAEWRIRFTTPGYQPRMYNEATALIDSAIAMSRDVQLYEMRIRTTYLAGDSSAALVTAHSVLDLLSQRTTQLEDSNQNLSEHALLARQSQLESIERILDGVSHDDKSLEVRLIPIRKSIESLRKRMLELVEHQPK